MAPYMAPSPSKSSPTRNTISNAARGSPAQSSIDGQGSFMRGALSGTMGASPFGILATAPELPVSTSPCSAVPLTPKSSVAFGRHVHFGVSLRRQKSFSQNRVTRTVSGGVTPTAPTHFGSRRVGIALILIGTALLLFQIVLGFVFLAKPAMIYKIEGLMKPSPASPLSLYGKARAQAAHADDSSTVAIISRLAAESRQAAAAVGATGVSRATASRRERLWPNVQDAQQQPRQDPHQQLAGHTQALVRPSISVMQSNRTAVTLGAADTNKVAAAAAASTGAKAASITANAAQVTVSTAATASDGKVAPAATKKDGAVTANAAAAVGEEKPTVTNAATTIKAAQVADTKKAAAASATAPAVAKKAQTSFPPFVKPVVHYAGRVANPPSIVGVVFYGRRDRVRILDCYLQRNMARNGGLLTSVVFVTATWQPADVAFLDRLVALRAPDYRKLYPQRLDKGYTGHYAWMDPATMYVKIDDDVVYFTDEAIDRMLIAHNLNRYHLISANVINHQPLELPHSQRGAHKTYEQTVPGDKTSWKPVMRSVALQGGNGTMQLQPVAFMDNGWDVWGDWRRAANVHYSFLANHAAGRLGLYDFPSGEELWDFNRHFGYTRWRINMIMFKGATIDVHVYNMSSTIGTYPGDDEDFITRILPQQLNRTSAAVSKALAVHFSFFKQREGLENSTDLLDRYALLAERTCGRLVPAE